MGTRPFEITEESAYRERPSGVAPLGRALASLGLIAFISVLPLWGCSKQKEEAAAPAPQTAPVPSAKEAATPPPQPPAAPAPSKMAGDPVNGKTIYNKHCHYCHGTKGMGDGPVGLAITPHPADFVHDTKRMQKTDEELLKSITDGIQREIGGEAMFMPAWKTILTEKERRDVLSYVRVLEREGKEREAKGKE